MKHSELLPCMPSAAKWKLPRDHVEELLGLQRDFGCAFGSSSRCESKLDLAQTTDLEVTHHCSNDTQALKLKHLPCAVCFDSVSPIYLLYNVVHESYMFSSRIPLHVQGGFDSERPLPASFTRTPTICGRR